MNQRAKKEKKEENKKPKNQSARSRQNGQMHMREWFKSGKIEWDKWRKPAGRILWIYP